MPNKQRVVMSVQSSPNIRWGIIGPGRIAHRFADAFSAVEDGELYAVASRNENRLHEFADQFSINKRYSDYQAILADKMLMRSTSQRRIAFTLI
ncbi:oxidoreductase [Vibrio astriarenae]|nr:oxidoreductase [Vibrio sp. C7]